MCENDPLTMDLEEFAMTCPEHLREELRWVFLWARNGVHDSLDPSNPDGTLFGRIAERL